MEKQITLTTNAKNFYIDSFIKFLQEEKLKGATHLKFWVANDPVYRFEWVETFSIKSEEEIKQEKIKELENELQKLKQ